MYAAMNDTGCPNLKRMVKTQRALLAIIINQMQKNALDQSRAF
jgi:hypothetical protein